MVRSLNEMAESLKSYVVEHEQPKHSSGSYTMQRLNNLKLEMEDLDRDAHVDIYIAISFARYSLQTGDKTDGSLGPEEKYIGRWVKKSYILTALNDIWRYKKINRGKLVKKEIRRKEASNDDEDESVI